MGEPDRVFLSDEEKEKVSEFVQKQFDEKGAEKFSDEMCAADANIAELIPGKTVSCAAVTKERKALGLMLPRGLKAKKTSPTKSLVKPWGKRKAKAEKTTSTSLDLTFMGNVKDMVELLKDQKFKIDAAIAALEALTKEAL